MRRRPPDGIEVASLADVGRWISWGHSLGTYSVRSSSRPSSPPIERWISKRRSREKPRWRRQRRDGAHKLHSLDWSRCREGTRPGGGGGCANAEEAVVGCAAPRRAKGKSRGRRRSVRRGEADVRGRLAEHAGGRRQTHRAADAQAWGEKLDREADPSWEPRGADEIFSPLHSFQ
jgi:hypothetical protein